MQKKVIHLLVGVGEVGSALKKILLNQTELYWFDINPAIKDNLPDTLEKVDVLHITFPQDDTFVRSVKNLVKRYSPELIVIHSTTVPGTTKKLGDRSVHSPILGQHNCLYKHIKTFRKAIGPNSKEAAKLSKKYLADIFSLEFYDNSVTTEAAKVLSLAKFAINIEMARYSKKFCDKLKVDYTEAYTKFSNLYNDGYKKNHLEKFIQPNLVPPEGRIGGSCVIPGTQKAQTILKSDITNAILGRHQEN